MKSKLNYNIITGQIIKPQNQRQFKSLDRHTTTQNNPQLNSFYCGYKLGIPRDLHAFKYTYTTQPPPTSIPIISRSQTTMNYTYQNQDLISHGVLNPYFSHLKHEDFDHQIKNANAKGIITKVIQQSRVGAPNYHQQYGDKVNKHQYNRKKQLCTGTLDLQKKYGMKKYFRKYK